MFEEKLARAIKENDLYNISISFFPNHAESFTVYCHWQDEDGGTFCVSASSESLWSAIENAINEANEQRYADQD